MSHKIMNKRGSNEQNFEPKNHKKFKHSKIYEEKRNLPIYRVKKSLIQQLRKHETVIILGQTGCGKTTQIPQYIFENNINENGGIVITQPRRIAAISVANRVAEEMNEEVGGTVGFKIRFQNNTGPRTLLTFATDGTLLREAMNDEFLSKYNVIILDEAHERTVVTDILFGIIKTAQNARKANNKKRLKLIIMSATVNADRFKEYFDNAPVIFIEGRKHSIDTKFTREDVDDYIFTCVATVFNIHSKAPANEHILVFLTGQEEIEQVAKGILVLSKNPLCVGPPLRVHTLYSSSDPQTQLDVFQPAPEGVRKVIISTNIAETSLTIPGIKHVVDSGKVKMKFHNPVTGIDTLKVVSVSQEQAVQRAGRAGRVSDGVCYHTFSEKQYVELSQSVIPEICRCNLSAVTMNLLAMKKNPRTFDFIEKPDEAAIVESLQELQNLGAVVRMEPPKLTSYGEKMSMLPLDPKYSKILLSAAEFSCLDEILGIIAMLSSDNIFINSYSANKDAQEIRRKFYSSTGDHITLLNIYRAFNKTKCKKEWCQDHYLSYRALDFAQYVKKQLMSYCTGFGFRITSCGNDLDSVRKCLITGLFNNVAHLQPDKSYITILSKRRASIHPSSALHRTLPHCIIFTELIESNELYMKNVTAINSEWLAQYIPDSVTKKELYNIQANKDE